MKSKFKCGDMMGTYWKAVDAYTVEEFDSYMSKILQRYPRVAEYLEREVVFEKWSRCHFLGMRYNITTTNMVESLNSMLLDEREYPYIALIKCYSRKNIQVVEQEAGNGYKFDFSTHTEIGR